MLILGAISESIVSAGIWIVSGIYHVAAFTFELFLILASGQLLDAASYELIITNFYVVLGIIMLFVLAFAMLKGMVNPDDNKQGTSTVKKVIINLITSAIIMAVLPTIFTFAFDFQTSFIMNQNTIGKFFGYGSDGTNDDPSSKTNLEKVQQGAYQIVNGVYTAFFNVNGNSEDCEGSYDSEKERFEACQANMESEDEATFSYPDGSYDKGEHTFEETMQYVDQTGSFGAYSAFAGNADEGAIEFNFLLSLIGGLLLIYVAVSFCFDMAVRLVKLVFFQLIAPIPVFFRIMPEGKLSGVFNTWTKKTVACYLEVYIRIFVFYFCVFLCNEMLKADFLNNEIYQYGFFLALLAKAFILMGIITFMRQAPKLLSEVLGIDSGNMSLGIKDKLAAGGAFTAGAILGGGATTLVRNAVSAGSNIKNKWGETKGIRGKAGLIASGIASTVAGSASGAVRSVKGGIGAKSFGDMKNAAGAGAAKAVGARDKRAAYKASHGGTTWGVISGHASDQLQSVKEWAGIGIGDANLGYYATAAQATDSFNSMSESTYKKKQEYADQNSKVKALKARLDSDDELIRTGQGGNLSQPERTQLELQFKREKAALDKLQRTMATKKKDVVSIAATKLAVDQKVNYSDNGEIREAYERAIHEGFGAENFQSVIGSETIQRTVQIDGKNVTKNFRVVSYVSKNKNTGALENRTFEMDENTTQIFDAMIAGREVNETWINEGNVIRVQDAIDKANIERQHIKAVKEREHIVKTGNRPTDKKDK